MDKVYDHKKYEQKIYGLWEKSGAFKRSGSGKPYTILMPPPNANASLHAGHAMYTIEDIYIRFKRMQGYAACWIPGTDHAGFETQFVYEKELKKVGKSRMDFDRETLYGDIYKFVKDNSGLIFKQMKRLGFSADWDSSVFTLDEHVTDAVFSTFTKMESSGLVYRDDYIVNYCTHCGTSLAELEVKHVERRDSLYYINYELENKSGYVTVATVRPETLFGDTAIAVNPKDKRYTKLLGKKVIVPFTRRIIPIITDESVDMGFGTGALKITPAHDKNDYEVGKRHNLRVIKVISTRGQFINPEDVVEDKVAALNGLSLTAARLTICQLLKDAKTLVKEDNNYVHSVIVCYKCGRDLEPLPVPNWYIKVADLKKQIRSVVKKDIIKFHPRKYKRHMLAWLDIMHDWPISRQVVWGIRIPVWYNLDKNPDIYITFITKSLTIKHGKARELLDKYPFEEIKNGLQTLTSPISTKYVISKIKPPGNFLQETDTFDAWFSSGHWPLITIKKSDYKKYLPTDLMGTLSDILKFWISRMILFSLYLEEKIPFKDVYFWSMVVDEKGVKMSKSKGNVINPIELVDKYGADALRFSLLYGIPSGGKAILSDNKVRGMRNFSNKVWNMARYISGIEDLKKDAEAVPTKDDTDIKESLHQLVTASTAHLECFKPNRAAELIYDFMWHEFADNYIEKTKERKSEAKETLMFVYSTCLKLLHPFMPFVTESVWQELGLNDNHNYLINCPWPSLE